MKLFAPLIWLPLSDSECACFVNFPYRQARFQPFLTFHSVVSAGTLKFKVKTVKEKILLPAVRYLDVEGGHFNFFPPCCRHCCCWYHHRKPTQRHPVSDAKGWSLCLVWGVSGPWVSFRLFTFTLVTTSRAVQSARVRVCVCVGRCAKHIFVPNDHHTHSRLRWCVHS